MSNRSVSILVRIEKNMVKYTCKSCKTDCDDITEHMTKVHKFSKWIMELQLKTNPNTYKNCFEKKV
jgi:transcription elongation factor Elf1